MESEVERGKAVFGQRCAVCHEGREGRPSIGPDLATLHNKGAPMLLENIILPDREVAPQYLLWQVELKDGEAEAGMIGEETGAGLTIF
ncbi:MAG: c-type cytochrome, partial [Akkermansiaceae bacterium]|nr:c-type cytochrome [Akkermansiaceae bacterium]